MNDVATLGFTSAPWADELQAGLLGSDSQVSGYDGAQYAAFAMTSNPVHPSVGPTPTPDTPMSSRYGALSDSSPFGKFLDSLYGIDPMMKVDTAAVNEAKTAGQPQAVAAHSFLLFVVGVGVLLIGVYAIATSDAGRPVVNIVKKAGAAVSEA